MRALTSQEQVDKKTKQGSLIQYKLDKASIIARATTSYDGERGIALAMHVI